jgi:hypothetical protein
MDTFWTIFFFIGKVSLLAAAAFPLFLVGLAIYVIIYRKWRVWQADELVRLGEMWRQLPLDSHGLTGVYVHLLTGAIHDMDQGDWADAAHKLAALSGAQGYSAVATQVVEEEAPMVQLPSMISTQDLQGPKDADL